MELVVQNGGFVLQRFEAAWIELERFERAFGAEFIEAIGVDFGEADVGFGVFGIELESFLIEIFGIGGVELLGEQVGVNLNFISNIIGRASDAIIGVILKLTVNS